jgi:hypothetical protein
VLGIRICPRSRGLVGMALNRYFWKLFQLRQKFREARKEHLCRSCSKAGPDNCKGGVMQAIFLEKAIVCLLGFLSGSDKACDISSSYFRPLIHLDFCF